MLNEQDAGRFRDVLSKYSFRFDNIIERMVCLKHGTTVSCSAKALQKHLRLLHPEEGSLETNEHQGHDLLQKVIRKKRKQAELREAVRLANNACVGRKHTLFGKYHNAGPNDILPPIRDLPIYRDCFKCPVSSCGTIVRFAESMRKHVAEYHKGWDSTASFLKKNCTRVSAQTLVASQRKYFAVYDPENVQKRATRDLLQLKSREEVHQNAKDRKSESQEKLCNDLISLFDGGESVSERQEQWSRRQTAAFLAHSHAEENLLNMEISKEKAEKITSLTRQSDDNFSHRAFEYLQRVCERYVSLVEETKRTEGILPGDLHRLSTPGSYSKTKTQEFQQTWATKKRYCNRMKGLIGMAFRLLQYSGKNKFLRLSGKVRESAMRLLECVEQCCEAASVDDLVLDHLHQLLSCIFLQSGPERRGTDLFMYTYQNCVCVGRCRDQVQFRQGTQVSPFISAVMFFASAWAVLQVFYFSEPENRSMEIKKVEEVFVVRANSPIGLLAGMRALCARLRTQELQQNQACFVECVRSDHPPMCGAVKLEHISPDLIGKAVHRMQEFAEILFMRMFPKQPVPEKLLLGLQNFQDAGERKDFGYSVYSEMLNKGILMEANRWVIDQIGGELVRSTRLKEKWITTAKRLHRLVIAIIFFSGGAPCRLTELSLILIENTLTKRGIYFVGNKVVLAPGYSKQISRNGGVFKPVLRVLDRDSSKIVKKYVVFVRPLLVKISEVSQRERVLLTMQETELSQVMKTQFLHFGIPGNVQIYRQWYNGYAKRRSEVAGVVVMASNSGSSSGMELRNGNSLGRSRSERLRSSMLQQSAHSVRVANDLYGVSQGFFGVDFTLWGSLYEKFATASAEFHADCNLEH